jgi:small Trp-rich protein
VLVLLKLLGIAPAGEWNWLWILSPFGLAVLWWAWADKTGMTQRKAMKRMDERKEARRQKAMEALGQGDRQRRK